MRQRSWCCGGEKMTMWKEKKVYETKMIENQNRLIGFYSNFLVMYLLPRISLKISNLDRTIFTSFKNYLNEHTFTWV